MLNVDGESGNVAAVYTHPLEHSLGQSGTHDGRDAKTYMNVGDAMGAAMAKLLAAKRCTREHIETANCTSRWTYWTYVIIEQLD